MADGKRRILLVGSGIDITVQFSETDKRTVPISWRTLQPAHNSVDLSSSNGAVTIAAGARNFARYYRSRRVPVSKPFRTHETCMIAIVRPEGATFCVLIKLINVFKDDIMAQWEVRNCA
ncbi:hypothetical protein [Chenggangzhangella methanolivorans]|uniref:Uncharacterized protein n=1 Tax=Chenggangzhangella methanolivorans TaxID=1437009 RepID=A0A9E6R942_9HYPH|nr:hypothetical protein [Chenggangzhangella methanolivorans]QZN99093.1 hypothetical protein K6K41_19915 [Chenggangzhangella methanolivorans]